MNIAILGAGCVGLCTGVTFAKLGNFVICTDIIKEKIEMINRCTPYIYEKGLPQILKTVISSKMLIATTDLDYAISNSEISFICVDTPLTSSNDIDLKFIKNCIEDVGKSLKSLRKYHVVVIKSTVFPSTTETVVIPILEKYSNKKCGTDFGVCVNPEFLREGNAIFDSLNPSRIIIGQADDKSGSILKRLYRNFRCPIMITDLRTAEMIKYATNVFLGVKISYVNELANICELFNIDIYEVMRGVSLDNRINPRFLNAGSGFGGSCLPKDIKTIITRSKNKGYTPKLIKSVLDINEYQPVHIVELAESVVESLHGKKVTVLGLSFKPNTDDVRGSQALPIIKLLVEKGAKITVYDPKSMKNFRKILPKHFVDKVKFAKNVHDALKNSEICIIQKDWQQFKTLKPKDFKTMNTPIVIDGMRTFKEPEKFVNAGIIYKGIGWKYNY
jgi:UDPglucose 6-dehydrogenase